jgi:hypothetical protein
VIGVCGCGRPVSVVRGVSWHLLNDSHGSRCLAQDPLEAPHSPPKGTNRCSGVPTPLHHSWFTAPAHPRPT